MDPKKVVPCIILFSLVVCFIQSPYVPLKGSTISSMSVTSGNYTQADRLSISYNDELIAAGFPGSGTKEDPYVIDWFEFPSVYFFCVDLYVVIRNCKFNYLSLHYSNNTRIESCTVDNFLFFGYCKDNIVSSNDINSGRIRLLSSYNFTITNNTLGLEGIFIDGETPDHWHHSFADNTVAEESLVYLRDKTNLSIDPDDYGMLILANCTNCTIADGNAPEPGRFIRAGFCHNTTFTRNVNHYFNAVSCTGLICSENTGRTYVASGIDLMMCSNTIVANNTFSDNERDGIALQRCSECIVKNNTVSGYTGLHLSGQTTGYGSFEESGINVYQSTSSLIVNNTLCGNPRAGIWYCDSSGFSILNNTIYENTLAGIDGYGSRANFSYNIIHDNQGPGLTIGYASFHNVTHNVFYDNNGGIIFDHEAAHNNISYNTIVDNETCIQVADQGDSCITNNAAYGGGFILSPSVYINFSGNTLNDKEVRYLWGVDSMSYDLSDYAQAFIYNCTNVSVSNGFFEGCVRGLSIAYSNFTSVTNITTANCVTRGLSVSDSHHSQIVNCTVSGGECGISMQYSSDNVITNITFSDNYNGIRILYTDRVKITNSSFTNSNFGIDTYRCQNLTIVDNEFFGCSIELTGSWVSHFNHTIEGNSVNGKPLGFFQELTDTVVSTDEYGTIMATLCTDVVFEGGNYSNVTVGVVLYNSVNCTITGIRSQYNSRSGIQLASCYNCTVKNCTFTENEVYGIEIGNTWSATRYTKVIDCVVNRNGLGIRVTYDRNTTIVNTTVSYNNDVGILLYYADWFTLTNCTVTDNGMTGVSGGLGFGMSSVTGNVISRNGWYGLYDVGGGSVVASNIISENAGHGISYEGTVLITGNQIHDNGGSGIITEFTGVTNITWNSITGNHEYGIVFERHAGYDRDNLIYGNSLGGNMLGNALDNGEDNRWDDGFIGNAWQDWTGVGVYNVPGLAGSVDNHPWIFGSEPPVRPLPEPTTTFPTTTTPTSPTTTTGPSPGEGWFGVLGLLAISGVSAFMGVIVTLIVVKRRAVPSRD